MEATDQPSHTPLLSSLLLAAGGAFWAGIVIAAGGGNAFFRTIVGIVVVLSLAGLILVQIEPARGLGENLVWALLGVEVALALLAFFSLTLFAWIPVVLTILAIQWWPRRHDEQTITALHLLVQSFAFLAVLAPFIVPL